MPVIRNTPHYTHFMQAFRPSYAFSYSGYYLPTFHRVETFAYTPIYECVFIAMSWVFGIRSKHPDRFPCPSIVTTVSFANFLNSFPLPSEVERKSPSMQAVWKYAGLVGSTEAFRFSAPIAEE